MKRVLTALLLIPFVVYMVYWAPGWLFLGVLAAAALLCYREYAGIAAYYNFGTLGREGYAAGLLVLLAQADFALLLTALALLVLAMSLRADPLSNGLPRAALAVIGILYVFGCWKSAIYLRAAGPHWLFYAMGISWAGDIAAFYVGRRWGRHKLSPRVSPGKSWEGAAASVALAIVFGWVFLTRLIPQVPILHAVVLSAAGNVAAQIGDLCESLMKRGAGVKDSGALLPGHGGLLDRVDSTLFVLPLVDAYVRL